MKTRKPIYISRKDAIRMLDYLNCFVVSLDRIGSMEASRDKPALEELSRFVNDWDVARKLAWMRRVVGDAYDSASSEAAVKRLERRLEKTAVWRPKG